MKMSFLFTGAFWGVVLVLIGVAVILKAVFHITIPIARLIFGFIIILFGIQVLFGGFRGRTKSSIFFEEGEIAAHETRNEYNVIFGRGTVNLRNLELQGQNRKIEINAIFGGADVQLPDTIPVKVRGSSVFGAVRAPDGNTAVFGDANYATEGLSENQPYLLVEANAVFGSVEIVR